jgi:hypothetical protein
MAGFRSFSDPATGEWIEYTAIAQDNGGELVRFNWRSVPGGVVTEHIHPHQEERFTIIQGEAHVTLAGVELVAGGPEALRAWYACRRGAGTRAGPRGRMAGPLNRALAA